MSLKIDSEFQSLIPPLSSEERDQLEENIKRDGCQDAIKIWKGENVIVDGHNRYEICERNTISYKSTFLEFGSRDDAMAWIIRNQFGRRNITNFVRAELALKLEPLLSKKAKQNQGKRTDISQKSVKSVDTQKEVAKAAKVSHDTIHKAKIILFTAINNAMLVQWE